MKFGFNWPSGFRRENCRQMTTDHKVQLASVRLKPLSHWNATTGDKFANSSRLFRDKDKRYKHNFHVAVSLNRHFCDKFANFGLILKIYRATVAR